MFQSCFATSMESAEHKSQCIIVYNGTGYKLTRSLVHLGLDHSKFGGKGQIILNMFYTQIHASKASVIILNDCVCHVLGKKVSFRTQEENNFLLSLRVKTNCLPLGRPVCFKISTPCKNVLFRRLEIKKLSLCCAGKSH